jgi:outer membrane immunogenic protein
MGGGQFGYNWQVTDRIVVGVETDFQGVTGGGSNWNSGWASSSSRGPSSIGTARGRAGYLVTPNLKVYGTGGLAYGAGN